MEYVNEERKWCLREKYKKKMHKIRHRRDHTSHQKIIELNTGDTTSSCCQTCTSCSVRSSVYLCWNRSSRDQKCGTKSFSCSKFTTISVSLNFDHTSVIFVNVRTFSDGSNPQARDRVRRRQQADRPLVRFQVISSTFRLFNIWMKVDRTRGGEKRRGHGRWLRRPSSFLPVSREEKPKKVTELVRGRLNDSER